MAFDTIQVTLGAAVANGGTFTVNYPTGKDSGAYALGIDHLMVSNPYGTLRRTAGQVAFTFGTSNITVTNNSGVAFAAGTRFTIQLDQVGDDDGVVDLASPEKMTEMAVVTISLGAPDVADADGVCASQALNTGVDGVIAGALAAGGVATFDVPRNVVAGWTNTAVITVTGTDEYGNVVVESSGSGTSFAGKKAFKTITKVRVSANVTGLTVGSGDVLGLPVFLGGAAQVLREIQDGAVPTAGAIVAGDLATPTATTGDVRGTYDPNAACDGSRAFQLIAALGNAGFKGRAQFAG